jgi:hypothetical protein
MELYHLQFLLQVASPEIYGYTFVYLECDLHLWKLNCCIYKDGRLIPFIVYVFNMYLLSTIPASAGSTSQTKFLW